MKRHSDRFQAVMAAPFGRIGIRTRADQLIGVEYLVEEAALLEPADALARETCAQIKAYIADPKHAFDLPYVLDGTPFQRNVWKAIAAIPCGETRTYGELAAAIRSAARPVGMACGSNPVPLVVPCHRVVAAGGRIGGFMHSRGQAQLSIKQWLLRHEGVI